MKIAICDNDLKNSEKLKALLYDYSNFKKTDYVVDIYIGFEQIIKEADNYFLIFLSFEDKNGKHISHLLQKMGMSKKLIIIGNDYRLASDAFMINAFNFIKKPYNKISLFEILESFFKSTVSVIPLIISNGSENFCINIGDILYLEADNKHSIIHLTDQTVCCNKTMAKVSAMLPENNFLKINRAFIVNLNHIIKFNSQYVTLSNNEAIHPGRHFYKSFKTDYYRLKAPIKP